MSEATCWSVVLSIAFGLCQRIGIARFFHNLMFPHDAVCGCSTWRVDWASDGEHPPIGPALRTVSGPSRGAFGGATPTAQKADGDWFRNGTALGNPRGHFPGTSGWRVTNFPSITATLLAKFYRQFNPEPAPSFPRDEHQTAKTSTLHLRLP